ncbi:hypothetical protein ACTXT7_008684 [Hymenolepis weldensis]
MFPPSNLVNLSSFRCEPSSDINRIKLISCDIFDYENAKECKSTSAMTLDRVIHASHIFALTDLSHHPSFLSVLNITLRSTISLLSMLSCDEDRKKLERCKLR